MGIPFDNEEDNRGRDKSPLATPQSAPDAQPTDASKAPINPNTVSPASDQSVQQVNASSADATIAVTISAETPHTPDASAEPPQQTPTSTGDAAKSEGSAPIETPSAMAGPKTQEKARSEAPWFLPKPKSTLFGQSIFIRLMLPIALIFVMTMLGAAYLNFTKFEQTYTTLAHERYDDVVRDLKLSIEESLGIGLSLGATRSTQVVIDRTVAQYDGDFALTILGTDGSVLFSTPSATVAQLTETEDGKVIINEIVGRVGGDTVIHKSVTQTHFLSTADIISPLGEPEGALVLEHNFSEVRDVIQKLGDILWRGVAILTGVFLIVIAAAVYLTVRPLERRFNDGLKSIESLMRTGDVKSTPLENGRDDLDTGFTQARAIEREMLAAEAHIRTHPVAPPKETEVA